ncbi:hypothetical protein [Lentzea sp. NPDC004782]|uniref:hypothetical protein n=1 Tax=Lentzea sp. NPDC004782 TaxID=3154458 RepID=UPI0033B1911D
MGTRRGGRQLPTSVSDYTSLDPFAAELAFVLVTAIKTRYPGFSDFLRDHMAAPGAPAGIAGDPADRKAFEDAKRTMSRHIGQPAWEIPRWDFVEFVLTRCGVDDAQAPRPRLAGLWQASRRYPPPGYDGPVLAPAGAPPPFPGVDELPNDKIRVEMLLSKLAHVENNAQRHAEKAVREFREAHETSLKFYERELTDLRARLANRQECERALIRIIAVQEERSRSSAERELTDTVTRLRRELEDTTAALTREKADHNLTANRLAFVAACLDAVSSGGDTDPVLWLRDADFPLGADLYSLLNQPEAPRTRTEPEAVTRFLTVYLRTYLISWFGDAPDRDDTVGPYRDIVRNGVLPPVDVLENVLQPHTITLQVAHPLMAELAPAERQPKELTEGAADVHTLEVLGGEHRTGVIDKPVNVVDLVQKIRRPGDTA